ncbi:Oligoribonuclease NrnB [Bacillus licheniformis]|nr:Oligoribonuclease NrnB [Bacillus licheniformis]
MYHLYSHNDLDGVGCGILAKVAFGERVEVRYGHRTRHASRAFFGADKRQRKTA